LVRDTWSVICWAANATASGFASLAAKKTFQGLEGNSTLGRKGGTEVGSICLSLFTYKYQVRNWNFINKWILQKSITTKANLLTGTSFLDLG
jgi:hypothetical protein